jgi:hypothetical protein
MPLFESVVVLLMSFMLGAGAVINARFGTKAATCSCEKGASVVVHDDSAEFQVGDQKIVVGVKQVTAADQSFALPAGWKQLSMTDGKNGIEVTVDGNVIGTILPTRGIF